MRTSKVAPAPGDAPAGRKSMKSKATLLNRLDEINAEVDTLRRRAAAARDPAAAPPSPAEVAEAQEAGRSLDGYETSVLHLAAAAGDASALRAFLRDPAVAALASLRDRTGWTPSHHASVVGRRVTFRVRAREAVIEATRKQELLNELAAYLGAMHEADSEANAALSTDLPAGSEAEPPLWTELEEEMVAGAITGVLVEVRVDLLRNPADEPAAAAPAPAPEPAPEPAPAPATAPAPAEAPESPPANARPIRPGTAKGGRGAAAAAAPLPGPADAPSGGALAMAGMIAVELEERVAPKVPVLEITLRHEADCAAREREKGAASTLSKARLVKGVRLADAVVVLRRLFETPPAVAAADLGSEDNAASLWRGALAATAATAMLSLHGVRLTNGSSAALGSGAVWVVAELEREADEPSIIVKALLRHQRGVSPTRSLTQSTNSPSRRGSKKDKGGAPEVPAEAPPPPLVADPPTLELRMPAEDQPYLDALPVRLSLWTEEGEGLLLGAKPAPLPGAGPMPIGWREVGSCRLTVRALSRRGAYGGVVMHPPGTTLSPISSRPPSPVGRAPSPSADAAFAGPEPSLAFEWTLVGEGQSAIIPPRKSAATAKTAPHRVGVPQAVADGPACLSELLVAGADADGGDLLNATPLHKAAAHGHLSAVALLLRAGASIEAKDSFGDRCLHRAAENGRIAAGGLLISRGAEIDAQNSLGEGPLHVACVKGELPFATMLLQAGASVTMADRRGWAPLHACVDAGHQPLLGALAAHCKARRLPCLSLPTVGSLLPGYPAGDSVVHVGLRACRLGMLKWMMDHGFGPAMLLANAEGHGATELVAALLPKLDKLELKKAGKGAKSALPAAAATGKEEKGKKKKKPPKNLLHGITPEVALQRLGGEGVKGLVDASKAMARELKVAAAAAAAKAKQDVADAKKRAEAEAKKGKGKGGGKPQMKTS